MSQTDPRARFWDKIAEKYAARPVDDPASYERKLEMTRGYLTPESEVLEIGCGTGTTALHHAPHAAHVRAIDVSPEMIRIARAKAKEAHAENVHFEVGTVESMHAVPSSYDMVMAHSILHLLPDRKGAITRAIKLLRPGGTFVSSTTCLGDWPWMFKPLIAGMKLVGKAPDVWFFTGDQLRGEIRAAGFEIVEDWQPAPRSALFLVAKKPA